MIPVPRELYDLLTFPGVVVRQVMLQLFCRASRTAVYEVCYFRVEDPAGYVKHEPLPSVARHAVMGLGYWIVGSLAALALGFPAAVRAFVLGVRSPFDPLLMWLAVSIAMHSLPSIAEAGAMHAAVEGRGVPRSTRVWSAPALALMYLGAVCSTITSGLFYGIAVALVAPWALVRALF